MTAPNLDVARQRLEQLGARGLLGKWAVRRDLRTIDFLDRHPDRKFPEDFSAWLQEFGHIFWIGDPGAYQILRARVLNGGMSGDERSGAAQACAMFGASCFVLLGSISLVAISLISGYVHFGRVVMNRLPIAANTMLLFTLGGILLYLVMANSFRRELEKLNALADKLD